MKEELIKFCQAAVQTRSYSDEEGDMAELLVEEMKKVGFDEVYIDRVGNAVGRIGNGPTIIHFDGHMDTVQVNDADEWEQPPFAGKIIDGWLWGRGSVDMKSSLCSAVYGAALAKKNGWVDGKTIYVTGSVCEEYCDAVSLQHFYHDSGVWPDYCIICEPSDNIITLGHKGKAQVRITTHGVSAHGSAPEKGKNAVYEMAEIIQRVEMLNNSLYKENEAHGTVVLSDICSVEASLNAVPTECTIYLDRRLAFSETLDQVKKEMDGLIKGKNADWKVGTLLHTSWTGEELVYEPMHDPWKIDIDAPLTQAIRAAYKDTFGIDADTYDFWDFGTNAPAPVSMGIPTIGFGVGEYKLAHMRNEKAEVAKIDKCCQVYANLIKNL
ncbi:MAG: YgeY family selenium metabolism-linked hydrolase [Clostridiales bacterium]